MAEDCVFFIPLDDDIPDEKRHMSVLCMECRDEHYGEGFGWYWKGSELGYGPYRYMCCRCEKIIHDGREENDG